MLRPLKEQTMAAKPTAAGRHIQWHSAVGPSLCDNSAVQTQAVSIGYSRSFSSTHRQPQGETRLLNMPMRSQSALYDFDVNDAVEGLANDSFSLTINRADTMAAEIRSFALTDRIERQLNGDDHRRDALYPHVRQPLELPKHHHGRRNKNYQQRIRKHRLSLSEGNLVSSDQTGLQELNLADDQKMPLVRPSSRGILSAAETENVYSAKAAGIAVHSAGTDSSSECVSLLPKQHRSCRQNELSPRTHMAQKIPVIRVESYGEDNLVEVATTPNSSPRRNRIDSFAVRGSHSNPLSWIDDVASSFDRKKDKPKKSSTNKAFQLRDHQFVSFDDRCASALPSRAPSSQIPLLSAQLSIPVEDEPLLSPMIDHLSHYPVDDGSRGFVKKTTADEPLVKFLLGDEGHSFCSMKLSSSSENIDVHSNVLASTSHQPPAKEHQLGKDPVFQHANGGVHLHSQASAKSKNRHSNDGNRKRSSQVKPLAQCDWKTVVEPDDTSGLPGHDIDDLQSRRCDQRSVKRRSHRCALPTLSSKQADPANELNPNSLANATYRPSLVYKIRRSFDHTPHEVFVELDELVLATGSRCELEWRQKSRWIKYEEDVEELAAKWGKPHMPSLSFHSLLELRRCIESGTVLLDLDEVDMQGIAESIAENMLITDQILPEERFAVVSALTLPHRHLNDRQPELRRQAPFHSLSRLFSRSAHSFSGLNFVRNRSTAISRNNSHATKSAVGATGTALLGDTADTLTVPQQNGFAYGSDGNLNNVQMQPQSLRRSCNISVETISESKPDLQLLKRIPKGAESAIVLVGNADFLQSPAIGFVRLARPADLPSVTEVPLPVRFLFVLLGPFNIDIDYHEIGRSLSTLLSNKKFHEAAYLADDRTDLLHAITEFLQMSIVLPPGEWEQKALLPFDEIRAKSKHIRQRRKALASTRRPSELDAFIKEEQSRFLDDPLRRTGKIFGSLVRDFKRRAKYYLSDFRDGFSWNCLTTIIFIFFTCLAPAITFGGLLQRKCGGWLGLKETLIATSFGGVFFALFGAQPLIVFGPSGPVLVFEESLYRFSVDQGIEFLVLRWWIGVWVFLFCIMAVAVEAAFLVKYVTRFSEDVFSVLVSIIFLTECAIFLGEVFSIHPVLSLPGYCATNFNNHSRTENSSLLQNFLHSTKQTDGEIELSRRSQPNTALLSIILIAGTFTIAYLMRKFRTSQLFGRKFRRALGDFGLAFAITSMTVVDYFWLSKSYTDKLELTPDFLPTLHSVRGWFIPPFGITRELSVWVAFAAVVPGFLLFLILFVEVQIAEMIIGKKEHRLQKGCGGFFNYDILLTGLLALFCSMFGLPWLCACSVRSVIHFSSLITYSTDHAPGQKPRIVHVREQRVTALFIHVFIGLCLLGHGVLDKIPIAVLFGVFCYLGFMNLVGVQMLDRTILFFVPAKYHPSNVYCLRVRPWRMHLFTIIQLACLAFVWTIKSLKITSFAFPFALMVAVLVRHLGLPFYFSDIELLALDGEQEDLEEVDFYDRTFL